MPKVHFQANVSPCAVEGFPADAQRSQKGALHIRPATTYHELTADEVKHIKRHHPALAKSMIEMDDPPPPIVEPAKEAASEDETVHVDGDDSTADDSDKIPLDSTPR